MIIPVLQTVATWRLMFSTLIGSAIATAATLEGKKTVFLLDKKGHTFEIATVVFEP
jgi:hypothetical protein